MYVCFIIKSSSSGSNNNSSPRCYSIVMGSAVSAAAPSVSREQSSQQLLLTITTQNSSPRLMLLHSTNIFMVVMLSPAGQGQAGGWRRTLGIIFTFWMHLHLFCRHQGTASTNTAILVPSGSKKSQICCKT